MEFSAYGKFCLDNMESKMAKSVCLPAKGKTIGIVTAELLLALYLYLQSLLYTQLCVIGS